MTRSTVTTEAASRLERQGSGEDARGARARALTWLATQVAWEQRLRVLVEAKLVREAAEGVTMPAPVAAPTAMGNDQGDLRPGGGVAHAMEAVGSPG